MNPVKMTFKSKVVTNSVENDWDLITPHLVSPDKVKKDQLRTWNFVFAHNGITLRGERIRKDALDSITETLVGSPRLSGHRSDQPGDGIIYNTWIEKIAYEDFVKYAGVRGERQKYLTKKAEEIDNGLFLAWGSFYRPDVSEKDKEMNFLIDSGVDKALSVSFFFGDILERSEKVNGKSDYLFMEFIDTETQKSRALEVSRVGVGNIPGAKTRSSNFYRRNKKMDFILNDLKVELKTQEDVNKLQNVLSENETKLKKEISDLQIKVNSLMEENKKIAEMTTQLNESKTKLQETETSLNTEKQAFESFKTDLSKLIVRNRILNSVLPNDTNIDEKAKEISNHLQLITDEWLPKESVKKQEVKYNSFY